VNLLLEDGAGSLLVVSDDEPIHQSLSWTLWSNSLVVVLLAPLLDTELVLDGTE